MIYSMFNLATTYAGLGRLTEAQNLGQQVTDFENEIAWIRASGYNLVTNMSKLAYTLKLQDRKRGCNLTDESLFPVAARKPGTRSCQHT